jgi:D-alanine-D-alanine ligase
MEVSVGVIDYKGETIVLGITEIVPTNEFFDYEAKYEGASEEITPARIDDETRKSRRNRKKSLQFSWNEWFFKK